MTDRVTGEEKRVARKMKAAQMLNTRDKRVVQRRVAKNIQRIRGQPWPNNPRVPPGGIALDQEPIRQALDECANEIFSNSWPAPLSTAPGAQLLYMQLMLAQAGVTSFQQSISDTRGKNRDYDINVSLRIDGDQVVSQGQGQVGTTGGVTGGQQNTTGTSTTNTIGGSVTAGGQTGVSVPIPDVPGATVSGQQSGSGTLSGSSATTNSSQQQNTTGQNAGTVGDGAGDHRASPREHRGHRAGARRVRRVLVRPALLGRRHRRRRVHHRRHA